MRHPVDLSCLLHVHSTYSDGTATVPELLEEARDAGADVLALTDHDTLGARRDGWEGWHDGVLLIVGHEVSPKGGHLLAFGLDEEVGHRDRSEAEICREVAARGGLAIAAHPFSEGSRMSRTIAPPHGWPALDDPCLAGLELWSLTSDVAESWRTPLEALRSLRRPRRGLDGPPDRHLHEWDRLGARRRVVGVGGLDAHAPGLRIRGRVRSVMPHARWFGILRTHVLLDEPVGGDGARDAAAVLAALAAGRCYLAREDLGPPAGFAFWATGPAGGAPAMGDEAPAGEWTLHAALPEPSELRLLRDGEEAVRRHGLGLEHRAEGPGVWRVEAFRGDGAAQRRWIVSNPIYLRGGDGRGSVSAASR